MNEPANRYITLRDWIRLVRDRAVLIVLVTLGCLAAAILISSLQPTRYTAQSELQVQDPSQTLDLAGAAAAPVQTPAQLAAQAGSTLITAKLITAVKRKLQLTQSIGEIRSMVSVSANSSTNLLQVGVTAPTGRLAAKLANAIAHVAEVQQAAQTRAGYAAAARRLQASYKTSRPAKNSTSQAIFDERLATLQALASVAAPVQVAGLATVPKAPTSPKVAEDAVIGAVLGLLLGLLIAVLRNAVDVRVRDARDIQEEVGFPLLGHVRASALGFAGDVPRGEDRLAAPDVEAFRMLRTKTDFLTSNGAGPLRTIAVTSALPEEGKSTTAAALAFAYAAAGRRTLLVECDLRRPCLAERLGLTTTKGLADYLCGDAPFREVVFVASDPGDSGSRRRSGADEADQGAETFGGSPDVIVAGARVAHPAELLGSSALGEFLAEASSRYDHVVLDTPPLLAVADTLEILTRADGLLLCIRTNRTTRDQVTAAKEALARLPGRPIGLVVTGLTSRDETNYGYYYYASSAPRTG